MKKCFYFLSLTSLMFSSCKPGFDTNNNANPSAPPCDNTTSSVTVSLIWDGTFYSCSENPYGNSNPPMASPFNYITTKSATGKIGSLADPNIYLCQLVTKNDQPASNPTLPCKNPGMLTFTWATPGATQTVTSYVNQNTDVTVDYYDICNQCTSSSGNARPHFSGVVTVPPGANQSVQVQMYTQPNYTSPNCQ